MKYIKEYVFSALAILMASCSSDSDTIEPEAQPPPVASSGTMSFSASIESGEAASKATRTSLADANTDSPYPIWSSGDQIKVLNTATSDARLFSINSSDVGKRAANFTGEIKVETGNNANNKFYAFYAGNVGASEGAPTISMSGSNVTVSGTIPSVQSSTPAFNPNLHFMTACTTGSAFSFKNGMALMKVTISDNNYENFKITKIILKSNNPDEKIAGDFTATIGDNGTLSNYSVTNGSSEIVIDNGTSALATGTYYIAINPCAFSSGFTLSFHENSADGNLKQYDRVKDASFPVAASEIINLCSYTGKECAKEAYVDLGITNSSGQKLLWSVENIYEYGYDGYTDENSFYAWGETSVKANQGKTGYNATYSWYRSSTSGEQNRAYKYGYGGASDPYKISGGALTKYNFNSNYGSTDNNRVLDITDDVAYVKSNGKWRMPSIDDLQALMNVATIIDKATDKPLDPDTQSKPLVGGPAEGSSNNKYKIMNRNTNHYILLPMKGYKYKTSQSGNEYGIDYGGYYWTRELGQFATTGKCYKLSANGTTVGELSDEQRAKGCMVRGVMYK